VPIGISNRLVCSASVPCDEWGTLVMRPGLCWAWLFLSAAWVGFATRQAHLGSGPARAALSQGLLVRPTQLMSVRCLFV
jgi:hypothetical protein